MLQDLSHLHDPHNGRLQANSGHLKVEKGEEADGGRAPRHLDEEFSVLLDVFVSRFLFLFLLGLHGDVDVHPQLLTATKTDAKFSKKKKKKRLFFNHKSHKPAGADGSLTSYIPGRA